MLKRIARSSFNASRFGFRNYVKVTVQESGPKFQNILTTGKHSIQLDLPTAKGGNDQGPNPEDLLCGALAACTSMTLRMYADKKKIPLQKVKVDVSLSKVTNENNVQVDQLERTIEIEGEVTDAQKQKLLEIADKCPIHRILVSEKKIKTQLK
jgi:putative redox protein